jgi:hypothetical protein
MCAGVFAFAVSQTLEDQAKLHAVEQDATNKANQHQVDAIEHNRNADIMLGGAAIGLFGIVVFNINKEEQLESE